MLPKYHILLGFIFSLILFIIFPKIEVVGFLIIFLSSFLIDVDHYIYYVFKKRDLNLKRAYRWFHKRHKRILSLSRKKRNEIYTEIHFFHGIEILIILLLLGLFVHKYFFYILIGFAFHLFLDIIHQRTIHDRLERISLIYDFIKFKKI